MNQGTSPEDATILAVIESLEQAAAEGGEGRADEAAETLERLYTELLGLMAYEMPPLVPHPAVKLRLMAAITGDETQEVPDPPTTEVTIPPPAQPTPASLPAPSGAVVRDISSRLQPAARPPDSASPPVTAAPAGPRASPAAGERSTAVRPRRSPFGSVGLLAAVLVLAMIALTSRLAYMVMAQRDTIASLAQRLEVERRHAAQARTGGGLRQLRRQLGDMREKLTLVTSPAVTVSALRPAGSLPAQPTAHGILFVAPDHQHWMLAVSGLAPSERGRVYQLWFIDDAGAHSGGTFHASAAGPVELSSPQMPPGTRDARITLEPEPGSAAPSGPEVLAAGQFQTL